MRSQLLRRVGIAHRGPVVDLGAGEGTVTAELVRRSRGPVLVVDRRLDALHRASGVRLCAAAEHLPLRDGSVDLIFAQHLFLWITDPTAVLREVRRTLRSGGVFVAVEPDFGGALEHPAAIAIAPVWERALRRAGADPHAGRVLCTALGGSGFVTEVHLVSRVGPPDPARFDRLAGLPLDERDRAELDAARRSDAKLPAAARFVHVPYVGILARPLASGTRGA